MRSLPGSFWPRSCCSGVATRGLLVGQEVNAPRTYALNRNPMAQTAILLISAFQAIVWITFVAKAIALGNVNLATRIGIAAAKTVCAAQSNRGPIHLKNVTVFVMRKEYVRRPNPGDFATSCLIARQGIVLTGSVVFRVFVQK